MVLLPSGGGQQTARSFGQVVQETCATDDEIGRAEAVRLDGTETFAWLGDQDDRNTGAVLGELGEQLGSGAVGQAVVDDGECPRGVAAERRGRRGVGRVRRPGRRR